MFNLVNKNSRMKSTCTSFLSKDPYVTLPNCARVLSHFFNKLYRENVVLSCIQAIELRTGHIIEMMKCQRLYLQYGSKSVN